MRKTNKVINSKEMHKRGIFLFYTTFLALHRYPNCAHLRTSLIISSRMVYKILISAASSWSSENRFYRNFGIDQLWVEIEHRLYRTLILFMAPLDSPELGEQSWINWTENSNQVFAEKFEKLRSKKMRPVISCITFLVLH